MTSFVWSGSDCDPDAGREICVEFWQTICAGEFKCCLEGYSKSALLPTEAAVTVGDIEVRREGARLELTESLRETDSKVASGVLHAQKPFWVGAFVGSRISVEEILVEMAFTMLCGSQHSRQVTLRGVGGVWCR